MGNKHKQLMDAGGVSRLHLAVFQGKQEKVCCGMGACVFREDRAVTPSIVSRV